MLKRQNKSCCHRFDRWMAQAQSLEIDRNRVILLFQLLEDVHGTPQVRKEMMQELPRLGLSYMTIPFVRMTIFLDSYTILFTLVH